MQRVCEQLTVDVHPHGHEIDCEKEREPTGGLEEVVFPVDPVVDAVLSIVFLVLPHLDVKKAHYFVFA